MESIESSALKSKIQQLQRQNAHGQTYIPDQLLSRLMTYKVVYAELKRVQVINPIYLEELAHMIREDATKVFAILVLVEEVGIVKDLLEKHKVFDFSLPLKLDILEDFGTVTTLNFLQTQKMFLAPQFTRSLLSVAIDSETVLPFFNDEKIGKEEFGIVYEISLDGDHQDLQDGFSGKLVRKELQYEGRPVELENLAILSRLKHPNIIELLCSYSRGEKYNLVFSPTEGSDLATLFRKAPKGTPFRSDSTLLFAFAGLASALERVHEFLDEKLDLQLIGSHHDLRPRNIFVSEHKLILADFGLSRFKKAGGDSKTMFEQSIDHYLAPECTDIEDKFKPSSIGRSSDIWSFGCILAEFMVYVVFGPKGVDQFKEDRAFKRNRVTLRYFHHGVQKNCGVEDWLSKFDITDSRCYRGIIALIKRMLSITEVDRPKAREVTACLRFMLISELAEFIDLTLKHMATKDPSLDVFLELTRFEAWKYGFGIVDHNGDFATVYPATLSDNTFDRISDCLEKLESWLIDQGADVPTTTEIREMAEINDCLEIALDEHQQGRARTYFDSAFLESKFSESIDQGSDSSSLSSLSRTIRIRAILKNMTKLSIDPFRRDTEDWQIRLGAVKISPTFNNHHVGTLSDPTGDKRILVEWCTYGRHASDYVINQEFLIRVERITKLLDMEKPESFCSLPCRGFYHAESRFGFGIIYELPLPISADPTSGLMTLKDLIKKTGKVSQQPILDNKFRLALTLANAMFEFHMVRWLHKDFSSSNIVFCPENDKPLAEVLRKPYIVGFNHSHPDEVSAFKSGVSSSDNDDYKHPSYQRDQHGYGQEYDYYSLGVVLLEIGLWTTLDEMTVKWTDPAEQVRKKLLELRVPSLGPFMGRAYQETVRICMTGEFRISGDLKEGDRKIALQTGFESLVVDRLRKRLD